MPRRLGLLAFIVVCCLTPPRASSAARGTTAPRPSRPEVAGHGPSNLPLLWSGLIPGRYTVGYRRLDDANLTVHVWYPAKAGGEPLSYGAYLAADTAETRGFLAHVGVDSLTIDRLMTTRLYAVASAAPEDRVAPPVLVAHGNGNDAADQVVLCEFLASHGYVVAATPSPMRRTPMEREDQVGLFAEMQASELAGAVARVAAFLPVDTTRIGVVGHSFGARAALLLAMNDPRVRAIVSLDGGIGTSSAVDEFRSASTFRAEATLPPLLHFYETLDAYMSPNFTLLESLHTGGLTLRPTRGMHHAHFTTYGFAAVAFPAVASVTQATKETRGEVVDVTMRTLRFLDRWLR